jgi:small subunit ribosomal protein S6
MPGQRQCGAPDEISQREIKGLALYECVFIARQDISAPQAEALADHFTKVIEDNGGTVAQREYWGLRSLAFRIRKNRKGHYMLLNVDAPAAALHEVDRQMRINEDVVRHLTVRVEAIKPGPSAMLQSRASREDRPRREGGRDDRRDDRPRRDDRGPRSFGDDEGGGGGEFRGGGGGGEFRGGGDGESSGRGPRGGERDFSGPDGR